MKNDSTSLSLGIRKFFQPHLFFPSDRRIRDLVISHLKGTRVLDTGCGNGWLSVCAWEKGFNVYSLDIGENWRLIIVVPNGLTFGLIYDKFIYSLVPTETILSNVFKTTFSLAKHDISMLNLHKTEPIGHCHQFTLAGIRNLIIEHGFKIVTIINCRFLSPYLRSFCALLGMGPIIAFERIDNRMAEYTPSNLAAEWVIVCEKFSND